MGCESGKPGALHAAALAEARAVEAAYAVAQRVDALATERTEHALEAVDFAVERLGMRLTMTMVKISARLAAAKAALDADAERLEAMLGECDAFTKDFPEADYADYTEEEWDAAVKEMQAAKEAAARAPFGYAPLADAPPLTPPTPPWEDPPSKEDEDAIEAEDTAVMPPEGGPAESSGPTEPAGGDGWDDGRLMDGGPPGHGDDAADQLTAEEAHRADQDVEYQVIADFNARVAAGEFDRPAAPSAPAATPEAIMTNDGVKAGVKHVTSRKKKKGGRRS